METSTAEGVIDAHHHVWDLSVRDQDWNTGQELALLRRDFLLADLESEARAAGVTATVLVQTIDGPEETPELLAPAQGSDLVAGVVGLTDLTSPDVARALAALREGPGGEFLWASATRYRATSDARQVGLGQEPPVPGRRASAVPPDDVSAGHDRERRSPPTAKNLLVSSLPLAADHSHSAPVQRLVGLTARRAAPPAMRSSA